jgi:hypothetical protein
LNADGDTGESVKTRDCGPFVSVICAVMTVDVLRNAKLVPTTVMRLPP